MESYPYKSLENDIFSEEPRTFDALLNLLYTYVGYNTNINPWDNVILEVDPLTGYAKWVFKLINGKMVPNYMDSYGCIDKIMIVA